MYHRLPSLRRQRCAAARTGRGRHHRFGYAYPDTRSCQRYAPEFPCNCIRCRHAHALRRSPNPCRRCRACNKKTNRSRRRYARAIASDLTHNTAHSRQSCASYSRMRRIRYNSVCDACSPRTQTHKCVLYNPRHSYRLCRPCGARQRCRSERL